MLYAFHFMLSAFRSSLCPFCFLFFLTCCQKKEAPSQRNDVASSIQLKYAKGFNVTNVGDAKLIEVTYPFQGATSGYKYLLV